MDFIPPDFNQVPYGSIEASVCAPQVEDRRFRGIMIRMPERIVVGAGEPVLLPVCGFYQLPSLPLIQGAVMTIHVRARGGAAVRPQAGQVVIADGDNEPDEPRPETPIDPRLWAHKVSESFFHLDAQRYLEQTLPPGLYEAYVSYGEAQSNVVRFEIAAAR